MSAAGRACKQSSAVLVLVVIVKSEMALLEGRKYQQPVIKVSIRFRRDRFSCKKLGLVLISARHCVRRDNPKALKLWFFTRKGVRTHGEPSLKGFFISGDRTFPR